MSQSLTIRDPDAAGETFSAGLLLHGLRVRGAHVDDVHVVIAQDDAVPAHEGLDPLPGPRTPAAA